jgi:hypothetical protein
MRESTWSIVLSGTVNADPESVAAWWCHRDRWTELLDRLNSGSAIDMAATQTRESGTFVRTIRYKTVRGAEIDQRIESNRGEDDMPPRVSDGYILESRSIEEFRGPHVRFTERCILSRSFMAMGSRETQVTETHEHTLIGGCRICQWIRRRSTYPKHNRSFTHMVDKCRAALVQAGVTYEPW